MRLSICYRDVIFTNRSIKEIVALFFRRRSLVEHTGYNRRLLGFCHTVLLIVVAHGNAQLQRRPEERHGLSNSVTRAFYGIRYFIGDFLGRGGLSGSALAFSSLFALGGFVGGCGIVGTFFGTPGAFRRLILRLIRHLVGLVFFHGLGFDFDR